MICIATTARPHLYYVWFVKEHRPAATKMCFGSGADDVAILLVRCRNVTSGQVNDRGGARNVPYKSPVDLEAWPAYLGLSWVVYRLFSQKPFTAPLAGSAKRAFFGTLAFFWEMFSRFAVSLVLCGLLFSVDCTNLGRRGSFG